MKVKTAAPKSENRPHPAINQDTKFFWDGLKDGKLLIQRCADCQQLRHPPSPMCPVCRSLKWDTIESKGNGVIYSFVVVHHPPLPAFEQPNPIGLIELDEGTRIVGGLVGIDPKDVKTGIRVQAEITKCDEELTLALFRPV